jgi:membrane protein implicated in regulation of membrane protease activity
MEAYQWTLIAALVLGVAELLTGSFLLLGLAVGALAAGLVQWLTGGLSLNRDLLVFALVSVLSFLAFRKIFRKADDHQSADTDVNRY